MEAYQGTMSSYEPSADELIDVLKNLENLAAINPALYRAIVDQIKGRILKKLENFSYSMGICCFFLSSQFVTLSTNQIQLVIGF